MNPKRLLAGPVAVMLLASGASAIELNSSEALKYYGQGTQDFRVSPTGNALIDDGTLNITNDGEAVANFSGTGINLYKPLSVRSSGPLSVANGIELTGTSSNTIESFSTFYLSTSSGSASDIVLDPTGQVGVDSNLETAGNISVGGNQLGLEGGDIENAGDIQTGSVSDSDADNEIEFNSNRLTGLKDPENGQDAATQSYVNSNDDTIEDNQGLEEVLSLNNKVGGENINFNETSNIQADGTNAITLDNQQNIGIPNGNLTLGDNSNITNFFDQNKCDSDEAIKTILPNGSYECNSISTTTSAENLSETLNAGNVANRSINLSANGVREVSSIDGFSDSFREGFEDQDIAEYRGETSGFQVVSSSFGDGGFALKKTESPYGTFDIVRNRSGSPNVTRGSEISFEFNLSTTAGTARIGFLFGLEDTQTDTLSGYLLEAGSETRLVRLDDGSEITLDSIPAINAGDIQGRWGSNGEFVFAVRNRSGGVEGKLTATDTTYVSGKSGFRGFSFSSVPFSSRIDNISVNGKDIIATDGLAVEGSSTIDGNVTIAGNSTIGGIPDPDQPLQAANKRYVDQSDEDNQTLSQVLSQGRKADQPIKFPKGIELGDSASTLTGPNFDASTGIAIGFDSFVYQDTFNANGIAIGFNASVNEGDFYSGDGVAVGYESEAKTDSGGIAIGVRSSVTGDESIALGKEASVNATNSVAIGHNTAVNQSNQVNFGNLHSDKLDVNVTGNLTVHQNTDLKGNLNLNANQINNIGGLQNCGSDEFINGNGDCTADSFESNTNTQNPINADLVAGNGLTGGSNNVLPGSDSDVTLSLSANDLNSTGNLGTDVVGDNEIDNDDKFDLSNTFTVNSQLTADKAAFGVSQSQGGTELQDSTVYVGGNLDVEDDIRGSGGDLAEKVNSSKELEQGEVAVIAGNMSLEESTEAYDTAVAGVISTDPGIVLAKNRDGKNLGLSGIVPVEVTTSNGEIESGDLLTTSNKAGRAMKCRDNDRCENAVIGKAMQSTDTDDKIRVLLTMG